MNNPRLPIIGDVIVFPFLSCPPMYITRLRAINPKAVEVYGYYVESNERFEIGQFDYWNIDPTAPNWKFYAGYMAAKQFDQDLEDLLK